jgi:hypothetical protein
MDSGFRRNDVVKTTMRPLIIGIHLRISLGLRCSDTDTGLHRGPDGAPGHAQVMVHLEVQPYFGGHPKIFAQTQGRVCGNSALSLDDLGNSPWRHVNIPCELIRAQTEGFHELFGKNLAGRYRVEQLFFGHVITF